MHVYVRVCVYVRVFVGVRVVSLFEMISWTEKGIEAARVHISHGLIVLVVLPRLCGRSPVQIQGQVVQRRLRGDASVLQDVHDPSALVLHLFDLFPGHLQPPLAEHLFTGAFGGVGCKIGSLG